MLEAIGDEPVMGVSSVWPLEMPSCVEAAGCVTERGREERRERREGGGWGKWGMRVRVGGGVGRESERERI